MFQVSRRSFSQALDIGIGLFKFLCVNVFIQHPTMLKYVTRLFLCGGPSMNQTSRAWYAQKFLPLSVFSYWDASGTKQ